MIFRTIAIAAAASTLACPAILAAQGPNAQTVSQNGFEKFAPRPSGKNTRIDYSFLDDVLEFMVLRMGPSTRQGLSKPAPGMGTRRIYGHESRVRLEGNRVLFSYLDAESIAPLVEYRQELERLGAELEIATLPREEQLAYWINLHNVAVIEQIALNYPIQSPSRMKLGPNGTPLDITNFVTVDGVSMSPRDIRTKIVFPNWQDANVVYGFFRGEVGGPSIQRRAYKGDDVSTLLAISAKEFVNSLRGVEGYGDSLLVSAIYAEAAPYFYPQMAEDLCDHFRLHAEEQVAGLLDRKPQIKINEYEDTVADLAAGDREPIYNAVEVDGRVQSIRVTPSIARLLTERQEKMEKLRREGLLRGRVIVLPPTNAPAATDSSGEETTTPD